MAKENKVLYGKFGVINILSVLILGVLLFEMGRDSFRDGDYIGFLKTGILVLEGGDIYSEFRNTWPPFFSLLGAVIAFLSKPSRYLIQFLWLAGSLAAFVVIMKVTVRLFFLKKLEFFKRIPDTINFRDSVILIPFLILFRFLLINLATVQVNLYLLLLTVLSLYFFIRKKEALSGALLALAISLKVYPIFLLLYFIYKREFKTSFFTLGFIVILNLLTVVVFGPDQAIEYYKYWYLEISSQIPDVHHKNQSVFAVLLRLMTDLSTGLPLNINFISLNPEKVVKLTYLMVAITGIYPMYLFRKKIKNRGSLPALLEYSVILNAIPLLSPISWKPYFIFLWIPYFLVFYFLFRSPEKKEYSPSLKVLFYLSLALNILTTEGIIGGYLSDVTEVYGLVFFGTLLLLTVQFALYRNIINKEAKVEILPPPY